MEMIKTAFKHIGKYNRAIGQFEAKPANEQTFEAFCTFIILEYARWNKHNHATVKSVGNGIIISMQKKSEEKKVTEDAAWAVAEIVQHVRAVHDKQIEHFMAKMHEMLKKLIITVNNKNTSNGQNDGSNHWCQCPHCRCHHPKIHDNK